MSDGESAVSPSRLFLGRYAQIDWLDKIRVPVVETSGKLSFIEK